MSGSEKKSLTKHSKADMVLFEVTKDERRILENLRFQAELNGGNCELHIILQSHNNELKSGKLQKVVPKL